jgi:polyhydroxyalkanoate synthesis regulator phasin
MEDKMSFDLDKEVNAVTNNVMNRNFPNVLRVLGGIFEQAELRFRDTLRERDEKVERLENEVAKLTRANSTLRDVNNAIEGKLNMFNGMKKVLDSWAGTMTNEIPKGADKVINEMIKKGEEVVSHDSKGDVKEVAVGGGVSGGGTGVSKGQGKAGVREKG